MSEFTQTEETTPVVTSSFTDQVNDDDSSNVDTKSVEHQLSVLQQRLTDKDEFINTLKDENQSIREMYAGMDERMKNMESISEVLNKQQDVSNQDTNLDENALVGKVIETLNKSQTEQVRQQNFDNVKQKLSEEFGAHVEEKVMQAATANGITYEDMVETAKKSPTAFYKLMGVSSNTVASPSPTRSSISNVDTNTNEKDFAYYSRLMRENPKEYFKPETQREFRKLFNKEN